MAGEKDNQNKEETKKSSFLKANKTCLFMVAACTVCLFAVYLRQNYTCSTEKAVDESGPKTLKQAIKNLQEQFPSQTDSLWKVASAAIKLLLDRLDAPIHPAVILLAGTRQTTATMDRLAKKIAEEVQIIFGEFPPVVFDCHLHQDKKADDVKLEMDKQLTAAFNNGTRVGLVLAIESLPEQSPMMFYRFCDTANAPFKNAVFILTLNMVTESTSEKNEEVYNELMRLWKPKLDEDQVDPLFSRIGNSIVFVREETDLNTRF